MYRREQKYDFGFSTVFMHKMPCMLGHTHYENLEVYIAAYSPVYTLASYYYTSADSLKRS